MHTSLGLLFEWCLLQIWRGLSSCKWMCQRWPNWCTRHWVCYLNDVYYRSGAGSPVVNECDGDYRYDSRKNILEWSLPVIDHSNKTGSMEFSINGHPDDFFPINVSFVSKKSYCDVEVRTVGPPLLDAVKCRYNVVQFITILHTVLHWQQQNIHQTLKLTTDTP